MVGRSHATLLQLGENIPRWRRVINKIGMAWDDGYVIPPQDLQDSEMGAAIPAAKTTPKLGAFKDALHLRV